MTRVGEPPEAIVQNLTNPPLMHDMRVANEIQYRVAGDDLKDVNNSIKPYIKILTGGLGFGLGVTKEKKSSTRERLPWERVRDLETHLDRVTQNWKSVEKGAVEERWDFRKEKKNK